MQVKVVAKVEMYVFISVVFANDRWPCGEDVSVKVRADTAVIDAWGRAAVLRCMVIGIAPKLVEVILRQTFQGSPIEKREARQDSKLCGLNICSVVSGVRLGNRWSAVFGWSRFLTRYEVGWWRQELELVGDVHCFVSVTSVFWGWTIYCNCCRHWEYGHDWKSSPL